MPHRGIDRLLYLRQRLVWGLEYATWKVEINVPEIPKQIRVANNPP